MNEIENQLEQAGYDYAIAIATQAEVEAGAACGQLCLVTQDERPEERSRSGKLDECPV